MKPAYYNEIDPYAAQWLRNLISAGHIPAGDVDDRDIRAVEFSDLAGYGQCHFFAGIGGFGLACRLAGFPDDGEIWTGGFPCQPFSVAGQQKAQADDRHLWPALFGLIERGRPALFLGENVSGIIKLALDGVLSDLESADYASRAFVIPACAVNAPHRRDRVWIAARSMADASGERCSRREDAAGRDISDRTATGREEGASGSELLCEVASGDVGNAEHSRCGRGQPERGQQARTAVAQPSGSRGFWDGAEYIPGADGKARRVEPGIRLLAHGVSGRVAVGGTGRQSYAENKETHWINRIGALRAGGNAIVPQVAAEMIKAIMETQP